MSKNNRPRTPLRAPLGLRTPDSSGSEARTPDSRLGSRLRGRLQGRFRAPDQKNPDEVLATKGPQRGGGVRAPKGPQRGFWRVLAGAKRTPEGVLAGPGGPGGPKGCQRGSGGFRRPWWPKGRQRGSGGFLRSRGAKRVPKTKRAPKGFWWVLAASGAKGSCRFWGPHESQRGSGGSGGPGGAKGSGDPGGQKSLKPKGGCGGFGWPRAAKRGSKGGSGVKRRAQKGFWRFSTLEAKKGFWRLKGPKGVPAGSSGPGAQKELKGPKRDSGAKRPQRGFRRAPKGGVLAGSGQKDPKGGSAGSWWPCDPKGVNNAPKEGSGRCLRPLATKRGLGATPKGFWRPGGGGGPKK